MSTIENIMIEKYLVLVNLTYFFKITAYMLEAICRLSLYRSHIKVYRPPSLKSKMVTAEKSSP